MGAVPDSEIPSGILSDSPCSSSYEQCEEWDLSTRSISPRSKLYRLDPIGVGTPYVESLSSYFRRLADAHCVSPSHLFQGSIAPRMGRRYLVEGPATKWNSFLGAAYRHVPINGVGSMASDWIRGLEELTLRNDLRNLTMTIWSSVISPRELFHDKPGWCSSCLNAWRDAGQEIRESLLWSLRPMQICDLHQRRLSFRCRHCALAQRPLCVSPNPGYCSHCGDWLGAVSDHDNELEGMDLNWQSWVTQSLGQILSVAPDVSDKPPRTRFQMSVTQLIDELCNGNSAAFAKQIGRRKNTVWSWLNLKHRIRISDLLAVCYWARLSPTDLLLGDLGSHLGRRTLFNDVRPSPPNELEKQRRVRRLDKNEIEAQLEALLASGKVPPTWKEVAALVNIDKVHLRRLFPELSKLIVAECKKVRALRRANRDRARQTDIRVAIVEARKRGLGASRRVVVSILKEQNKVGAYLLISAVLREESLFNDLV